VQDLLPVNYSELCSTLYGPSWQTLNSKRTFYDYRCSYKEQGQRRFNAQTNPFSQFYLKGTHQEMLILNGSHVFEMCLFSQVFLFLICIYLCLQNLRFFLLFFNLIFILFFCRHQLFLLLFFFIMDLVQVSLKFIFFIFYLIYGHLLNLELYRHHQEVLFWFRSGIFHELLLLGSQFSYLLLMINHYVLKRD